MCPYVEPWVFPPDTPTPEVHRCHRDALATLGVEAERIYVDHGFTGRNKNHAGLREIKLNIGGSVHDPADLMGKLLFNVLVMISEFEADLISMRTREGMKVAKANGRLWGKQPKLTVKQETYLLELHDAAEYTMAEMPELFSISRSTSYRAVERSHRKKSGITSR